MWSIWRSKPSAISRRAASTTRSSMYLPRPSASPTSRSVRPSSFDSAGLSTGRLENGKRTDLPSGAGLQSQWHWSNINKFQLSVPFCPLPLPSPHFFPTTSCQHWTVSSYIGCNDQWLLSFRRSVLAAFRCTQAKTSIPKWYLLTNLVFFKDNDNNSLYTFKRASYRIVLTACLIWPLILCTFETQWPFYWNSNGMAYIAIKTALVFKTDVILLSTRIEHIS